MRSSPTDTSPEPGPSVEPDPGPRRPEAVTAAGRRLRWWREVAYVLGFYLVYSWIRNQFGSAGNDAARIAYEHALDIIRVQDAIGLWFEPELQRWYLDLPARGLIRVWNIYYGTAHFIVTAGALIWLYRRQPDRYSVWRTTLAAMTALALIGFAGYSLMPPRLLGSTSQYGACFEQEEGCRGVDMVDTLEVDGGWLSFDDDEVATVSNQYAATPSLHTGWSTWSAFVMWGLVRRRWVRGLVVLYPVATVFCIMITANHFWLDAVGGLVVFAGGYGIARALTAWTEARLQRRDAKGAEPSVDA
ncbi:phosphatase PAP2 family protein [soil metagenome]